jgi:hypothetical protein
VGRSSSTPEATTEAPGRCPSRKVEAGCRSTEVIEFVQPFPSGGHLGENLGLLLPLLLDRIGNVEGEAYSYVVVTVGWNPEAAAFEQHGSAPNFQGGVLTLCTCKHRMRAARSIEDWRGTWLAGFTSRNRKIFDRRHWLFYLAQVESAHESHAELWANMKDATRRTKAADANYLGDVFRPKSPPPTADDRFSPNRYITPRRHAHRWRDHDGWHEDWRNDVSYHLADGFGHPPLLVADPRRTFLWDEPMIYLAANHSRSYRRWSSLQGLLSNLRGNTP